MKQEILVSVTPHETRVAVLEDDQLQEFHLERSAARTMVGNIVLAKVERVLPGMQAAFVDIGQARNGFLHAADVVRAKRPNTASDVSKLPAINELLREGEQILVQVSKDPLGDKGARLTAELSIPSRNLVFLPFANECGVSKLIASVEERERLKKIVERSHTGAGAYIVRTSAAGASENDLSRDQIYLQQCWSNLQNAIERKVGDCLFRELSLSVRCLRDLAGVHTQSIHFDAKASYTEALEFANHHSPEIADKLHFHDSAVGLFDTHDVEFEIAKIFDPRVVLPCGGELVIEHTEAMTVIDVNSAAYVGAQSAQQTLITVNSEAATEIARQLRLRNIGGIIIVDFIDMDNSQLNAKLLSTFQAALSRDSVNVRMGGVSPLGLVELSRKRSNQSAQQLSFEGCTSCGGMGTVKTTQAISFEILREISRQADQFKASSYTVVAAPAVVEYLTESQAAGVADVQAQINCSIKLKADPLYSQSQYDIALA